MFSVLLKRSGLGRPLGGVPGAGSREPENPSATLKRCPQLPIWRERPGEMLVVGYPKVSTLGVPVIADQDAGDGSLASKWGIQRTRAVWTLRVSAGPLAPATAEMINKSRGHPDCPVTHSLFQVTILSSSLLTQTTSPSFPFQEGRRRGLARPSTKCRSRPFRADRQQGQLRAQSLGALLHQVPRTRDIFILWALPENKEQIQEFLSVSDHRGRLLPSVPTSLSV